MAFLGGPWAVSSLLQQEVRRGDVAYQLPRPVSFTRATLAQCAGTLSVRAPILGAVAFVCAFAFTGAAAAPRALLWLFPFGLVASLELSELYVLLGLMSFWLTDATSVYWVMSKLLFVLGGLMLPLELYPDWLQSVARYTPFPYLLAGPAGFLLRAPGPDAWTLGASLSFWALLLDGLVELSPVSLVREPSWAAAACALGAAAAWSWLAMRTFGAGLRRYSSGSRFGLFG